MRKILEGGRPEIMRNENESGLSIDYGALYWMAYRMLCADGGERFFGDGTVHKAEGGVGGHFDNAELALDAFLSCAVGDVMP